MTTAMNTATALPFNPADPLELSPYIRRECERLGIPVIKTRDQQLEERRVVFAQVIAISCERAAPAEEELPTFVRKRGSRMSWIDRALIAALCVGLAFFAFAVLPVALATH